MKTLHAATSLTELINLELGRLKPTPYWAAETKCMNINLNMFLFFSIVKVESKAILNLKTFFLGKFPRKESRRYTIDDKKSFFIEWLGHFLKRLKLSIKRNE